MPCIWRWLQNEIAQPSTSLQLLAQQKSLHFIATKKVTKLQFQLLYYNFTVNQSPIHRQTQHLKTPIAFLSA
jgi:hypothetical protein